MAGARRIAFAFALALTGGLLLSTGVAAANGNAGDFWLNNTGTTASMGHVPHLQSRDIALIAKYPGGSSGTFTIVAWKPTGDNHTVVYSGTWAYKSGGPDVQTVAVISIDKLFANMPASFKAQPQQGFHFKMFCSLGKHSKMKEFWVAAPKAPTTPPETTKPPSGGVLGETGSTIALAKTGGPLLGLGLLLILGGGLSFATSRVARRRS